MRLKTAYPKNCIYELKKIFYQASRKSKRWNKSQVQDDMKQLMIWEVEKIIIAQKTELIIKNLLKEQHDF